MKNLIFILVLTLSQGAQAMCHEPLLIDATQWVEMLKVGIKRELVRLEDLVGIEKLESPPPMPKSKKYGASTWAAKFQELNRQLPDSEWKKARVEASVLIKNNIAIENKKTEASEDTDFLFATEFGDLHILNFGNTETDVVLDKDGRPIWLFQSDKYKSEKSSVSTFVFRSNGNVEVNLFDSKTGKPKTVDVKIGNFEKGDEVQSLNAAGIFTDKDGNQSIIVRLVMSAESPFGPGGGRYTRTDFFEFPLDIRRVAKEMRKLESNWAARAANLDLFAVHDNDELMQTGGRLFLKGNGRSRVYPFEMAMVHIQGNPFGKPYFENVSLNGFEIYIHGPEQSFTVNLASSGLLVPVESLMSGEKPLSPWIANDRLLVYGVMRGKHLLLIDPFAPEGSQLIRAIPVAGKLISNPVTISHPRLGDLTVAVTDDDMVHVIDSQGVSVDLPWQGTKPDRNRRPLVMQLSWIDGELIADVYTAALRGATPSTYQRVKLYRRGGAK